MKWFTDRLCHLLRSLSFAPLGSWVCGRLIVGLLRGRCFDWEQLYSRRRLQCNIYHLKIIRNKLKNSLTNKQRYQRTRPRNTQLLLRLSLLQELHLTLRKPILYRFLRIFRKQRRRYNILMQIIPKKIWALLAPMPIKNTEKEAFWPFNIVMIVMGLFYVENDWDPVFVVFFDKSSISVYSIWLD